MILYDNTINNDQNFVDTTYLFIVMDHTQLDYLDQHLTQL